MNNGHRPRWAAFWFVRHRSVTIETRSNGLFDPHALSESGEATNGTHSALTWSFFMFAILLPAIVLGWFTFGAANVNYQSPYALLLAAIIAGCFLLEASHQFHQLRSKPHSKDRPYPLRVIQFALATTLFFAIMLVASCFALRIENYSLYVLAGNYAPYLLHHLLLVAIVYCSWTWYGSLVRGKTGQRDRQPFSGRSPTSDDEARRRRKELFK